MHISDIAKNPWVQMSSVGIISLSGGIGIGYILAKKHYEKIAETLEALNFYTYTPPVPPDMPDEEVVIVTEHREEVHVLPNHPGVPVQEEEEELVKGELIELRPQEDDDDETDEDSIAETGSRRNHPSNVVVTVDETLGVPGWDWPEELAKREADPKSPYILHQDEFYHDERGYTQTSLAYYSQDQVLLDESDTPIYNYGAIVGPLEFGHGSSDPNILYVRNEPMQAEYEISLLDESYEIEKLGIQMENDSIEHSLDRFRPSD
ncbi:MAG: hypothetical protein ABWY25_05390 [Paenisporosarcina sp.]